MHRRTLLKLLTGFGASALIGTRAARAEAAWTPIGYSQAGLPLVVHHLGGGAKRIFILGGQHGGPEANTTVLANRLLEHFADSPWELPEGVGLDIMPLGNPDGASAGSRQFLSGVDPNRNWASSDWQSDAYDSNGVLRPGLGGSEPFSEQETRALRDWVLARRPTLILNYHSAGGFMFGGRDGLSGELSAAFAEATGYHFPQPSAPGSRSGLLPYRATGSMGVWQRENGLPGIFVELTSPSSPEWDRNLLGVRTLVARVSALT